MLYYVYQPGRRLKRLHTGRRYTETEVDCKVVCRPPSIAYVGPYIAGTIYLFYITP